MEKIFNKQLKKSNTVFSNIVKAFLLILLIIACSKKAEELTPSSPNPTSPTPPFTTPPKEYPDFNKLGYSTNIGTGKYADVASLGSPVINLKAFYDSEQNRIEITNLSTQENIILAGENALSLSKSISGKLKVSKGLGLFKASISYFDSTSFNSDYIYSSYNLQIRQKRIYTSASTELLRKYLTNEFILDSKTQSPADLVKHYGTHVIKDLIIGGKFEAVYKAKTSSVDRRGAASAGVSAAIKKLFDLNVSGGYNSSYAETNSNQQLYYYAVGGLSNISLSGSVELGSTINRYLNTNEWQKSVTPENSVMIDFGSSESLIPLDELIPDATKADEVKQYIEQYLIDNQLKMVDAPPAVFQYFDETRANWAYSLRDEPSIYGRLLRQGAVFRAFGTQRDGAVGIKEYESSSNGDLIYTAETNPTLAKEYKNNGIKFYAYNKPMPGTKPVYQFLYYSKKGNKVYVGHYYSLSNTYPGSQNWHYDGVAFYAYEL
ncbi:MAC/perforin domain-containing protein [Arcicella rosea]|uniref:MACPF domain-containing protein n=1 Tax=Arcicella rosea TaxID=502909 RepID=A0A841ER65_9BACT|nr:MAC/perforin domain-containing protein [Arcicella rosea]MBB6003869.1 hypothetical protein [Arcicella rosea]